jgi:hypothetical protein
MVRCSGWEGDMIAAAEFMLVFRFFHIVTGVIWWDS